MNADELRELADRLTRHPELATTVREQAASYLRACADAMDAGPVATVRYQSTGGDVGLAWKGVPTGDGSYPKDGSPLYPLAMPAPMTDAEVDALIAETEYMPTDRAVRYLVSEGERRVKEANK